MGTSRMTLPGKQRKIRVLPEPEKAPEKPIRVEPLPTPEPTPAPKTPSPAPREPVPA